MSQNVPPRPGPSLVAEDEGRILYGLKTYQS